MHIKNLIILPCLCLIAVGVSGCATVGGNKKVTTDSQYPIAYQGTSFKVPGSSFISQNETLIFEIKKWDTQLSGSVREQPEKYLSKGQARKTLNFNQPYFITRIELRQHSGGAFSNTRQGVEDGGVFGVLLSPVGIMIDGLSALGTATGQTKINSLGDSVGMEYLLNLGGGVEAKLVRDAKFLSGVETYEINDLASELTFDVTKYLPGFVSSRQYENLLENVQFDYIKVYGTQYWQDASLDYYQKSNDPAKFKNYLHSRLSTLGNQTYYNEIFSKVGPIEVKEVSSIPKKQSVKLIKQSISGL